ncbi:MAG: SDR family oxidoreductase [Armatimonadetes bacterium]|nr:SDR family oxidoreductase [Armatimonadota bacterium]
MQSKRILVTGSSRGIGRAIALRLAESGWKVAVHSARKSANLEGIFKELGSSAAGAYSVDLADPSAMKGLFESVLADGPLHGLVNNAGVYMPMDTVKSTDAQFDATLFRTFAVNFESPMRLCRLASQHFAAHGGGKIVNVCSRVGFKGESGASIYAASKAALINVTRSLAMELAPKKVQLFGIAPGWVDTAMSRDGMQDRLENILKDIPAGRMASPKDCAAVVNFLLSPEAEYLSGDIIDINGASYFH